MTKLVGEMTKVWVVERRRTHPWAGLLRGGRLGGAVAGLGYGEGGGGFELHGAGEEDVVLEVDVLVEVALEFV